MDDQVRRCQPEDPEVAEQWVRRTDEPEVRGVAACRIGHLGYWQVSVWAMEFVRTDPLESGLRQRIMAALLGASGVTSAEEEDREVWLVTGSPSGRSLVEAAAQAVDALADQIRVYLRMLSEGHGFPGGSLNGSAPSR